MDKHIVNDPGKLVLDSLSGLVRADDKLMLDKESRVVYLKNQDRSKVALISGGGAGHEPAHSGWVTPGILTAAVTGNVFASPNVRQISRGIELVTNSAGTLIIVKNYTGDVLHFGLVKEKHAASSISPSSAPVRFLIVGDDCSVPRSQSTIVGRRGLAGTVLVYKVAGALASRGANIVRVETAAKYIAKNVGTVAVGLGHCHLPGTGASESHLAPDEMEIGMGIHNEPGFARIRPIPSSLEVIDKMMTMLTATDDPERSYLSLKEDGHDEVVLLVNNLGGLSELELGSVANDALLWIEQKSRLSVKKTLVGTFMTSLNMPGFSLTLLVLPRKDSLSGLSSIEILELLEEKDPGSKWRFGTEKKSFSSADSSSLSHSRTKSQGDVEKGAPETILLANDPELVRAVITAACRSIIAAEPYITKCDTIAGDGDAGLTLRAGAEAILAALSSGRVDGKDIIASILSIATEVEEVMGGTSGALYSIYLNGLVSALRTYAQENRQNAVASPPVWAAAANSALQALYQYTRARPPSRTLVDPLDAFVKAFTASPNDFSSAVDQAKDATEETRKLEAKAGRAAYVEQSGLGESDIPDPGAWGVWALLDGIRQVISN